jgi:hypothetical protein
MDDIPVTHMSENRPWFFLFLPAGLIIKLSKGVLDLQLHFMLMIISVDQI